MNDNNSKEQVEVEAAKEKLKADHEHALRMLATMRQAVDSGNITPEAAAGPIAGYRSQLKNLEEQFGGLEGGDAAAQSSKRGALQRESLQKVGDVLGEYVYNGKKARGSGNAGNGAGAAPTPKAETSGGSGQAAGTPTSEQKPPAGDTKKAEAEAALEKKRTRANERVAGMKRDLAEKSQQKKDNPLGSPTNYYDMLGVSRSADAKTIKDRYRLLSKFYHPNTLNYNLSEEEINLTTNPAETRKIIQDMEQQKAILDRQFKLLAEAYETLSDDDKRKKYDQFGKAGAAPGGTPGGAGNPGARGGADQNPGQGGQKTGSWWDNFRGQAPQEPPGPTQAEKDAEAERKRQQARRDREASELKTKVENAYGRYIASSRARDVAAILQELITLTNGGFFTVDNRPFDANAELRRVSAFVSALETNNLSGAEQLFRQLPEKTRANVQKEYADTVRSLQTIQKPDVSNNDLIVALGTLGNMKFMFRDQPTRGEVRDPTQIRKDLLNATSFANIDTPARVHDALKGVTSAYDIVYKAYYNIREYWAVKGLNLDEPVPRDLAAGLQRQVNQRGPYDNTEAVRKHKEGKTQVESLQKEYTLLLRQQRSRDMQTSLAKMAQESGGKTFKTKSGQEINPTLLLNEVNQFIILLQTGQYSAAEARINQLPVEVQANLKAEHKVTTESLKLLDTGTLTSDNLLRTLDVLSNYNYDFLANATATGVNRVTSKEVANRVVDALSARDRSNPLKVYAKLEQIPINHDMRFKVYYEIRRDWINTINQDRNVPRELSAQFQIDGLAIPSALQAGLARVERDRGPLPPLKTNTRRAESTPPPPKPPNPEKDKPKQGKDKEPGFWDIPLQDQVNAELAKQAAKLKKRIVGMFKGSGIPGWQEQEINRAKRKAREEAEEAAAAGTPPTPESADEPEGEDGAEAQFANLDELIAMIRSGAGEQPVGTKADGTNLSGNELADILQKYFNQEQWDKARLMAVGRLFVVLDEGKQAALLRRKRVPENMIPVVLEILERKHNPKNPT